VRWAATGRVSAAFFGGKTVATVLTSGKMPLESQPMP
jgi:hypothetical protein